ncbi:MAG: hypothetical protein B0W54_00760 [Cellvibrio sp. 79]|nr:MAG: hypothetical protein B0W54_00760 [Cellvibrio sp. 79]
MNSLAITNLFSVSRFSTLTLSFLMLVSCGGGGGNSGSTRSDASSAPGIASSISTMSSPGLPSSSSSVQTSISSSQVITSSSSSSTKPQGQLIDASSQFTAITNEYFYVFSDPTEPQVLHYLPKQLALTGLPGVASVQRTNKVSNLLKMFLDLSSTDWYSTNQLTFSSRFTLDVDLQKLQQESEAAGFTQLADVKVKPPAIQLEQRYTTVVPAARVQIQCKNLTLLINGNAVTLHDCNLIDKDEIIAPQTINNIGSFRYEALNFDPEAISGNKSLRGTLAIDYTLPGTREFDRILSTADGDLQHTWQLYFNWPLSKTNVSTTNITINWKTLLANLDTQISAGTTRWDETTIKAFVSSAISTGAIVLAESTNLTTALDSALVNYLKQELFVAIYTSESTSPLTWAPKLRFKNVDQLNNQTINLRYFDSELLLVSKINLRCLTAPDAQNNIFIAIGCEANNSP